MVYDWEPGREPGKPVLQRVCKGRDKGVDSFRLGKREGQGTGEGTRTCRSVSEKGRGGEEEWREGTAAPQRHKSSVKQ